MFYHRLLLDRERDLEEDEEEDELPDDLDLEEDEPDSELLSLLFLGSSRALGTSFSLARSFISALAF